ncbi:MAG: hypothetical protein KAG56_00130 [Sulfurovaceae bacterium]|nr:hypothetical protein [Sulfurovaceae bacterium]
MKKIINALLIIDIGILIFCLLSGSRTWLINSQIGFISSSLIMFASIISYRNMVQVRVDMGMVGVDDNRDTLDKIEDPFDLYSEDDKKEDKNFKEVIDEERDNLKKNRRSIWQTTKDSKAALSFYRLGAYVILIFGFFYLNNNEILDIGSYLFALALPPVIVVMMLMRQK